MIEEEISFEYITHSGDDLLVVDAARASFNKRSDWDKNGELKSNDQNLITFLGTGFRTKEWEELLWDIGNCPDANQVENWLRELQLKPQHWAPFAHPHLTLRMTIPVFLARQYVKHQVGGVWSEESRRYVKTQPTFWFPKVLHVRPEDIKQGSGSTHSDSVRWLKTFRVITKLANSNYKAAIEAGIAPEEARMILPLNHMTTVVWTGSLAFWARVANQRVDSHAQLAAQEAGKKLSDVVRPYFRYSWAVLTNGK